MYCGVNQTGTGLDFFADGIADISREFRVENAAGKILKYKMREDAARRLNIAQVEGIVAN